MQTGNEINLNLKGERVAIRASDLPPRPSSLPNGRLYTLGFWPGQKGAVTPVTRFFPMSHKEAVTFKNNMTNPSDWILYEIHR